MPNTEVSDNLRHSGVRQNPLDPGMGRDDEGYLCVVDIPHWAQER